MNRREKQVIKSCIDKAQTNLSELKEPFAKIQGGIAEVILLLRGKIHLCKDEETLHGLRHLVELSIQLQTQLVELQTAAQLLHGGK